MSPTEYPERPPYFAHLVVRMMQKACAANDIGVEACWLVTTVAHVEDAKHYTGPVTFWNAQLLPICGLQSWGRLDRARKKAVDAGWLHYVPGRNRTCGQYWTLIPAEVSAAFNDSPIDESNSHHNGAPNGDKAVIQTGSKRGSNGEPFNPVPVPVPNTCPDSESPDFRTAEFIWKHIHEMQPTRKSPKLHKWADTIRLMRERDGRTDEQIRDLFLKCHNDDFERTNVLCPERLRKRWDDLELKLKRSQRSNGTARPDTAVEQWHKLQKAIQRFTWPDQRFQIQNAVSGRAIQAAERIGWQEILRPLDDTQQRFIEHIGGAA